MREIQEQRSHENNSHDHDHGKMPIILYFSGLILSIINKELMESLIHFYKERNLLYVINGEGDFDNVFDNINEGLLSVNK